MASPKPPVHRTEVPEQVWYEKTDREIRGKALSDVGGVAKIGVGVLELPPGCNTRPGHYHTDEEEHLYVLEGHPTLHLGDRAYPLRPGSYVHFPASQEVAHYLVNEGSLPAVYIMIGERLEEDRVIYP